MMNSREDTVASKGLTPPRGVDNSSDSELAELRAVGSEVQQIRLEAQRELSMARQLRAEAERYRLETGAKARSEAQLLILKARLETKKETAELRRRASEEMQKVLADIRMLRIAAQEELEAQRKFTDVARICALSQTGPQAEASLADKAAAVSA